MHGTDLKEMDLKETVLASHLVGGVCRQSMSHRNGRPNGPAPAAAAPFASICLGHRTIPICCRGGQFVVVSAANCSSLLLARIDIVAPTTGFPPSAHQLVPAIFPASATMNRSRERNIIEDHSPGGSLWRYAFRLLIGNTVELESWGRKSCGRKS